MPTTTVPYGTDITASLTVRTLVSGAAGLGSANGAAFDNDGHLYLSTPTITGLTGTSWIRRVDPNDGTVLASIQVDGMANPEYFVKRALVLDAGVYFASDNPQGDHNWKKPKPMDSKRHPITVIGRVHWIGGWAD